MLEISGKIVFWDLISKYALYQYLMYKQDSWLQKIFCSSKWGSKSVILFCLSEMRSCPLWGSDSTSVIPFTNESQSQDTTAVPFFSTFPGMEEMRQLAGWSRLHRIFSKSVQALSCNCIVLPFISRAELFSLKGHWNVYFTVCPFLIILLWIVVVNVKQWRQTVSHNLCSTMHMCAFA